MRLIKIEGKIWELTTLQDTTYAESPEDETSLYLKNTLAIQNLGWFRGIVRTLSNRGVKSLATAIIETTSNGLPIQNRYDIYHNSKGFFCKVKGSRVFLEDLLENQESEMANSSGKIDV